MRVKSDGLVMVRQRASSFAFCTPYNPSIRISTGVVGVYLDRPITICQRLINSPLSIIDARAVGVGRSIAWLDFNRFAVVCERLIQFSRNLQEDCPVVVSRCGIWVKN